mgnify:CR=1 FL=1
MRDVAVRMNVATPQFISTAQPSHLYEQPLGATAHAPASVPDSESSARSERAWARRRCARVSAARCARRVLTHTAHAAMRRGSLVSRRAARIARGADGPSSPNPKLAARLRFAPERLRARACGAARGELSAMARAASEPSGPAGSGAVRRAGRGGSGRSLQHGATPTQIFVQKSKTGHARRQAPALRAAARLGARARACPARAQRRALTRAATPWHARRPFSLRRGARVRDARDAAHVPLARAYAHARRCGARGVRRARRRGWRVRSGQSPL